MSIDSHPFKPRRSYDPDFKKDAVNRVIRTGKSCAEVARELGLPPNMLARWRRQLLVEADQNSPDTEELKPSELAEQLRQAHKELADLREQRDILKKALSIFSQDSGNGGRS